MTPIFSFELFRYLIQSKMLFLFILVWHYLGHCLTHKFLKYSNSKWKFLEGVKASGAPPPRKVIVQQCSRDVCVLEVLCNYVSGSAFGLG